MINDHPTNYSTSITWQCVPGRPDWSTAGAFLRLQHVTGGVEDAGGGGGGVEAALVGDRVLPAL